MEKWYITLTSIACFAVYDHERFLSILILGKRSVYFWLISTHWRICLFSYWQSNPIYWNCAKNVLLLRINIDSGGACLLCIRGGSHFLRLACRSRLSVLCETGERKCCSLRNENLQLQNENLLYEKWKSVVCAEMKIGDVDLRLFPQQKKAKP